LDRFQAILYCRNNKSYNPNGDKDNISKYIIMQKKRKLRIKDKKIKALMKDGGRNNARDDFFELLKRAVRS
jgi:hypothetical protein